MKRNGTVVSYSAEELRAMNARGENETDWVRFDAMTEEELEAAIASDPDEAGLVFDPVPVALDALPPEIAELLRAGSGEPSAPPAPRRAGRKV